MDDPGNGSEPRLHRDTDGGGDVWLGLNDNAPSRRQRPQPSGAANRSRAKDRARAQAEAVQYEINFPIHRVVRRRCEGGQSAGCMGAKAEPLRARRTAPIAPATTGCGIEMLATTFGTIENVPYPWDSVVWAGIAVPMLGGFDPAQNLGLIRRPDVAPQSETEKVIGAIERGVGGTIPLALLTAGGSTIPQLIDEGAS